MRGEKVISALTEVYGCPWVGNTSSLSHNDEKMNLRHTQIKLFILRLITHTHRPDSSFPLERLKVLEPRYVFNVTFRTVLITYSGNKVFGSPSLCLNKIGFQLLNEKAMKYSISCVFKVDFMTKSQATVFPYKF